MTDATTAYASRQGARGASALYVRLVLIRILIIAVIVLFAVMWVRAAIDVFRRGDLTTSAKAAWAILMLILPFIGLLIYTLVRPTDAQIAQRAQR